METNGSKSTNSGGSSESGGTIGLDDEVALIRTRPPYSRKDLIISKKVMKNMCTSLICDVCGEPAEVRCNCCKLLFCSTLCLLKSEPKHKIICETSPVASQEDSLVLLNSQSKTEIKVKAEDKKVQEESNLEKKIPHVQPIKGLRSTSLGQNSFQFDKSVGCSESPTDASQQQLVGDSKLNADATVIKVAQPPPAQDEVKPSSTAQENSVLRLPRTVFRGNQMIKTSFSEVKTEEEVKPLSPPVTPCPFKGPPNLKSHQGMETEILPVQTEEEVKPLSPPITPYPFKGPPNLESHQGMETKILPGENQTSAHVPLGNKEFQEPSMHLQQVQSSVLELTPDPSPLKPPVPNLKPVTENVLLENLNRQSEKADPELFTRVQIVTTEDEDMYWVLDLEAYDKTFAFDDIIRRSEDLPVIRKPKVNLWCTVAHDSDWYRAEIIDVVPLTVFLMDIGIVKAVKCVYELPESLYDDPPLAVKVWAKDAPSEYLNLPIGTPLTIRKIGQFEEGIIVEILGITGGPPNNLPENVKPSNHILDQLYSNDLDFCVRINKIVGRCGLIGTIIVEDNAREKLPSYNDCDSMIPLLSKSLPDPNLRPQVGDLVSAKLGEFWYRGVVYHQVHNKSEEEIKVGLIDYGLVTQPKAMCSLPDKLRNQYSTAVRLNFDRELDQTFELIGKDLKGLINKERKIVLDIGIADIARWEPSGEDFPETFFPVYSGMFVLITTFASTDLIYIQPADCPELYTFLEAVNADAHAAPVISKKPFCGDLIACSFSSNDIFYRAKVLRQNGLKFDVIFVDFGNTATVNISEMRYLSSHFKLVPFYAIKIGLDQLVKSALNQTSRERLQYYVNRSIKLKLEIEGSLDSVVLVNPDGDMLNSELEKLLSPDLVTYTIRNLRFEKFHVGQEIDLAILQMSEVKNPIAMDIKSEYGVPEVLENFSAQLTLHCGDYKGSYTPEEGEVVCAKYADEGQPFWYRAIALKIFQDSCVVFFVDYGNFETVAFHDVCPIGGEFMMYPVPVKEFSIFGMDVFSDIEKGEIISKLIGKIEKVIMIHDADHRALVFMPSLNAILKQYNKPEIMIPPYCL